MSVVGIQSENASVCPPQHQNCSVRRSAIQRPQKYYGNDRSKLLMKTVNHRGKVITVIVPKLATDSVIYQEPPVTSPTFHHPSKRSKLRQYPALQYHSEVVIYERDIPLVRKICKTKTINAQFESDIIAEALKMRAQQMSDEASSLRVVQRRLNGKAVKIKFVSVETNLKEKIPDREKKVDTLVNATAKSSKQCEKEAIFDKVTPPWVCETCYSVVDGRLVQGMKHQTYFAYYKHLSECHAVTPNPNRCQHCGCCMALPRLVYHRFQEHGILPSAGLLENRLCMECGNVAQDESDFEVHRQLHEIGHDCSVCRKPFSAIQDLLRHLESTGHQSERRCSFKCPALGCGDVFYRSSLLIIHIRKVHNELALIFDLEGWPSAVHFFRRHDDDLRLSVITGGVSL